MFELLGTGESSASTTGGESCCVSSFPGLLSPCLGPINCPHKLLSPGAMWCRLCSQSQSQLHDAAPLPLAACRAPSRALSLARECTGASQCCQAVGLFCSACRAAGALHCAQRHLIALSTKQHRLHKCLGTQTPTVPVIYRKYPELRAPL